MISYFVLRTPLKDECLKRWLPCCLSFLLRFGFFAGKQSKSTSPLKKKNCSKKTSLSSLSFLSGFSPFFEGPNPIHMDLRKHLSSKIKYSWIGKYTELPWIHGWLICISSLYMGSWARWFQANWNIYARQIELPWTLWSTGFFPEA